MGIDPIVSILLGFSSLITFFLRLHKVDLLVHSTCGFQRENQAFFPAITNCTFAPLTCQICQYKVTRVKKPFVSQEGEVKPSQPDQRRLTSGGKIVVFKARGFNIIRSHKEQFYLRSSHVLPSYWKISFHQVTCMIKVRLF